MRVTRLSYGVAVPVPHLDRRNRRIPKARQRKAMEILLKALGDLSGGATAMPSAGAWRMLREGGVMVDVGQTVVLSMTTRRQFARVRRRVEEVVRGVGDLLDQEAMAVIAYPRAGGFLVFGKEQR